MQDDGYIAKLLVGDGAKDISVNVPLAVIVEDKVLVPDLQSLILDSQVSECRCGKIEGVSRRCGKVISANTSLAVILEDKVLSEQDIEWRTRHMECGGIDVIELKVLLSQSAVPTTISTLDSNSFVKVLPLPQDGVGAFEGFTAATRRDTQK